MYPSRVNPVSQVDEPDVTFFLLPLLLQEVARVECFRKADL